jgi:hypothetical protein
MNRNNRIISGRTRGGRSYADRAAGSLGTGYEVSTMTGKTRVNAQIAAVTYQARKENSENNTILKSLRG